MNQLQDGDLLLVLLKKSDHHVHKVPTLYFRMVHAETGEELGAINLRLASNPHIERYAGHIGYAVHPQFRGHAYARRALQLLVPVASAHGIDPLWITCDPDNIASQRTLFNAGAAFIEQVDVPADCIIHQSGHRQKLRFALSASNPERA